MKTLNTTVALVLGCGLVLAANAAILGMVALNRQGEPVSELSLTERELAMPQYRQEENSGFMLSLRLTHQLPDTIRRTARLRDEKTAQVDYSWFDHSKLEELGFQIDVDPSDPAALDHYETTRGRPAFIVVEFDGDGWNRWLAGREEQFRTMREKVESGEEKPEALASAEELLEWDRTMRSRLFPVDAGIDASEMRRRYPDRQRYAVIRAVVVLRLVRPEEGAPYLNGMVRNTIVSEIHVPIRLREYLEAFLPAETWNERADRERKEAKKGWPAPRPPRYRIRLTFGSRNDPWLSSIEVVGEPAG